MLGAVHGAKSICAQALLRLCASTGAVEGFSVFKSSKSAPDSVVEREERDEDGHLKERKEMYRQMEV